MLRKPVILVCVLLLLSAGFIWQGWNLWGVRQGKFIDYSSLKVEAAAKPASTLGLEQIAALHLFGNAADKPLAPPVPTELPKTDLKLVLVGAITDTDPKLGSALIDADHQTKRYFVGDNIPGGAVLHEVLESSVVLKRENRYETLAFPKAGDNVRQLIDTAIKGMSGMANAQPTAPTAPAMSAPYQPTAPPVTPGDAAQPAKPTGLSLRERFQKQPMTPSQPPQGSP